MTGCFEMTGSTLGHLQPQVEEPRPSKPPDINKELVSPRHRRMRQRMTPVPPEKIDPPIQLTPVWEHVVRTQHFPPDIDKHSTFTEISERLRDPEWEVRQHALRVLIDVVPTLPKEQVDSILSPVVPELINNLGHLAPAVRKGAIDALRVYLVCSENREIIVNNILESGLSRQAPLDPLQISITQGLILSTPSLLCPSPATPSPSDNLLSATITTLAHHLIQINHQEAALKSLLKIRDTIGSENFAHHLSTLNPTALKDFQVLCEVYKVNESPMKKRMKGRSPTKSPKIEEINGNVIEIETKISQGHRKGQLQKDSDDFETSGSRVLLETEIKLNEDTAITMTISEEKDNLPNHGDHVEGQDEADDEVESKDVWIERRKTPRRVHFGGEIVKMRTPDSDDSEVLQSEVKKTKIPLPIAPVTKLPLHLTKSSSNPSSPNLPRSDKASRRSRSASISPKREFYVHDGTLSPKKGILTKNTSHSMTRVKSISLEGEGYFNGNLDDVFGMRENDRSWSFEVFEDLDSDIDPRNILHVNDLKFKKKSRKKSSRATSPRKFERTENKNVETSLDEKIEANDVSSQHRNKLHGMKFKSSKILSKKSEINEVKNVRRPSDGRIFRSESASALHHPNDNFHKELHDELHHELHVNGRISELNLETSPGNLLINNREIDNQNFRRSSTSLGLTSIEDSIDNEMRKKSSGTRSSSRKAVYESFPRKERNYILMELSSPVKMSSRSREVSPVGAEEVKGVIKGEGEDKGEKSFVEKSGEGESKGEANWEDLGLVTQDVLDDLHNKVKTIRSLTIKLRKIN
uniref:Xkr4 protein n=1 Tax=Fopius arisanus TaxID=64838 RepID=A0A0C9PL93_9HYME